MQDRLSRTILRIRTQRSRNTIINNKFFVLVHWKPFRAIGMGFFLQVLHFVHTISINSLQLCLFASRFLNENHLQCDSSGSLNLLPMQERKREEGNEKKRRGKNTAAHIENTRWKWGIPLSIFIFLKRFRHSTICSDFGHLCFSKSVICTIQVIFSIYICICICVENNIRKKNPNDLSKTISEKMIVMK